MFNFASIPQSPSRIFSDGTRLFKTSFSKIWLWQLLWLLPIFILLWKDPDLDMENHSFINNLSVPGAILVLAITLIPLLIYFFGHCFSIHRLYSIATQPGSISKDSLKTTGKKFLPAIGGSLFLCVIYLGGLIASGALIASIFYLLTFLSKPIAFIVALLLSVPVALIFICLPFMVIYYLQLILLDNYSIFKSIKQSYRLVRGNWWRNFLIYMLIMLIETIVSNLSSSLLSLSFPNAWLINVAVSLTILSALNPWVFSVLLVQFNDLKVRQGQISPVTQLSS